jgi:hypothetical protein
MYQLINAHCQLMFQLMLRIRDDEAFSERLRSSRCDLTRSLLVATGADSAWCYKKKRNGELSRCLKTAVSIFREGVCREIKQQATIENFVSLLYSYVELMQVVRCSIFSAPAHEVDFVDKFYKLQLQGDLLKTDVARHVCGESGASGYVEWVRRVVSSLRTRFNVCVDTRSKQKERTSTIRTHGLEHPLCVKMSDVLHLVDALRSHIPEQGQMSESALASSLCLLQLAVGGRARDIIAVNTIAITEDGLARIGNVTKRKTEMDDFCISKPVLLAAFSDTLSFAELFMRTRETLFSLAISSGMLCVVDVQYIQTATSGYPVVNYATQWDKISRVESFVQSWCAKMRRHLRAVVHECNTPGLVSLLSRGRGTHQLRKLYVACSYVQSGQHMKETAWAQRVLGHSSYDTSLLYTNMTIKTGEDDDFCTNV